jgi:hypothetical protein
MFALRRLGRDAIACVMTQRADVPVPAGLPSCDLAGLGREQTEQLVQAIAGARPAPAVAGRLHAETGGNPLALVELAAALTAEQLGSGRAVHRAVHLHHHQGPGATDLHRRLRLE